MHNFAAAKVRAMKTALLSIFLTSTGNGGGWMPGGHSGGSVTCAGLSGEGAGVSVMCAGLSG